MLWHWSVDVKKFKKENPKAFRLWRLTHLLNYGVEEGEKISKKELKKAWPRVKEEIDPYVRRAMEYLLWGRLYSLPNNLSFWNWPKKTAK